MDTYKHYIGEELFFFMMHFHVIEFFIHALLNIIKEQIFISAAFFSETLALC